MYNAPYPFASIPDFLIGLVVAFLILLISRLFWLWYWRINVIIDLQKRQLQRLRQIARVLSAIQEDDGKGKMAETQEDEETVLKIR